MSPRHAAAVLGFTNTAGAIAGLLGVASTGLLLQVTDNSWELSLFYPCIGCAVSFDLARRCKFSSLKASRQHLLLSAAYCCIILSPANCTDYELFASDYVWYYCISVLCVFDFVSDHRVYVIGAMVWITWVDASPHDFDRGPSPGISTSISGEQQRP
jgi:hypothetical protein